MLADGKRVTLQSPLNPVARSKMPPNFDLELSKLDNLVDTPAVSDGDSDEFPDAKELLRLQKKAPKPSSDNTRYTNSDIDALIKDISSSGVAAVALSTPMPLEDPVANPPFKLVTGRKSSDTTQTTGGDTLLLPHKRVADAAPSMSAQGVQPSKRQRTEPSLVEDNWDHLPPEHQFSLLVRTKSYPFDLTD